jgi:hypothetical protein
MDAPALGIELQGAVAKIAQRRVSTTPASHQAAASV